MGPVSVGGTTPEGVPLGDCKCLRDNTLRLRALCSHEADDLRARAGTNDNARYR